jgi:pimeloyl-ACP methyl ester carboxylesterase
MPTFTADGVRLHYEDTGSGSPVVLLHGVWMSSRFFGAQTATGALPGCRTIALDFRGHGASDKPTDRHTIASYASDVRALIEHLDLREVTLVGWSMGAFVAWEYLATHDDDRVTGLVVVDESASDFAWPGWDYGVIDAPTMLGLSSGLQTDQRAVAAHFAPEMFATPRTDADLAWMVDVMCSVPPTIASTVLLEQTLVDYREALSAITVPTLVCFGRDETLLPVAAGEDLVARIPDSSLVVFEHSSHCPFIEEPELFNTTLAHFATTRTVAGVGTAT